MAVLTFLSYFLIGAGPGVALFYLGLSQRPILVLMSLSSAFFWLISLIVIAGVSFPLLTFSSNSYGLLLLVLISVSIQEVARVYLFRLYLILEKALGKVAASRRRPGLTVLDKVEIALAAGVGHGATHSALFFVSLLAPAAGPATFYSSRCPQLPFFLVSAVASLAMFLLHSFSMVLAFDAFEHRTLKYKCIAPAFHLLASLLTMINHAGYCLVGLGLLWSCSLTLMAICAVVVANRVGFNLGPLNGSQPTGGSRGFGS